MQESPSTQTSTILSFNKVLLGALILLVIYVSTLYILKDSGYIKTIFNDFSSALINLMAAVALIYAAKISIVHGRRIYVAWSFIAAAQLVDAINDIVLSIWEVVLHKPVPSLTTDIFFIGYFLLFTLGIFLIPRSGLIQKRWVKLLIDIGIIFVAVFLILWNFLILPTVGGTGDVNSALHLTGVVLYIILLFLMVDLLSSQVRNLSKRPLIFLALSLFFQILSNIMAIYPPLHDSYNLIVLMNTSWILSYLSAFFAALLQANTLNRPKSKVSADYEAWYLKSDWISYLPSSGIFVAYILLVWGYEQPNHINFPVLEAGVGCIIGLLLLHQARSFKENKKLYKDAEEDILKRKQIETQMEASLVEKEALLREIHHRVKNNLQVISSLLSLQASYINDEQVTEVLKESRNRVKSMANVHEKLYQSKNLSKINFNEYVTDFTRELYISYGANPNITIKTDIHEVFMGIDTAVPCGLMINEIISNSLKHAFPGKDSGEISIKFVQIEEDYILTVKDNGIGLPPEIELDGTSSMGLMIVNALKMQLDSDVTIRRDNGTEFEIRFKELNYDQRI